jgi:GLPGLI family protein
MKKIFYLILISSFYCYSQNKSLNIIKVEYKDVRTYNNIINIDNGLLLATNEYSYYNSSILKKEKKSEIDNSELQIAIENDEHLSEIIVNRKTNILTERLFESQFLKNKFDVIEDTPKFKWVITKDTKFINKYLCKKATTEFRGRKYEVWYTEKIPVSIGPWKFNGLPGLILVAEDKEGIYKWEAKSIRFPYDDKTNQLLKVVKDKPSYKKISFKEYDKKFIDAIIEKIEIIKTRNSTRKFKANFEYSTEESKEPINEWRTQTYFQ